MKTLLINVFISIIESFETIPFEQKLMFLFFIGVFAFVVYHVKKDLTYQFDLEFEGDLMVEIQEDLNY